MLLMFTGEDITVEPNNVEGMAAWSALGYKPKKIVMTKQL